MVKHPDTCPTCQRDHSRAERAWYECPVCKAPLCEECVFDGLTERCERCGKLMCKEHRVPTDDKDLFNCPRCAELEKEEETCQRMYLALR